MANLETTQATTITRLVQAATVRARLGVSSSFDTVIGDLIDEATDAIQQYLGYSLAYQVYVEKVPGFDDEYLVLSRMPVVTVTQVLNDTSVVTSTAYEIYDGDAGLIYNSTGWAWTARRRGDVSFDYHPGSEDLTYSVTYGAGYRLPGTSTSSTIVNASADDLPASIKRAALLTASQWFEALNLNVTATQFEEIRTDDFSIKTHPPEDVSLKLQSNIPDDALNLLRPFERNF